ncbi:BamA/TamA family outer membrane protein [Pedobacter jamesrossensis]|uniref:BamA/TamA family outer membrane protein n=1 Tax=Pedobacter jamesrossensis TaxID=1908238 RepID=A0ABV8NLF6_9SPHI
MKRTAYYLLALMQIITINASLAQLPVIRDSIIVKIMPSYDSVSILHRKIFGENYRKEYAAPTKLPVLKMSDIVGGLKAYQRGGGNQTRSVRLTDSAGNEWTLRSVEKYPEILLPPSLRETFLRTILKDNMSAQHPFSALVVPVLADEIGAPHTDPIIGWVAKDKGLGEYEKEFAEKVNLLEKREPIGSSDNTQKMMRKLKENNSISYDSELYLKLKCLDVLIGDWDRHDDQWRWKLVKSGINMIYVPIPRDRDQVFYRSDGKVQRYAQSSWFLPMMQGYERNIQNINWFLWEGREINSKWFSGISEEKWNLIVSDFCSTMTDQVFETALKQLPEPGYTLRHNELLKELQERRAAMPFLMNDYYRFFNKIVDIELSDKAEIITVKSDKNKRLSVTVSKHGHPTEHTYFREFDPEITREVRIYLHNGNDSLVMNNDSSPIKIRLIGGSGSKNYNIDKLYNSVKLYTPLNGYKLEGTEKSKLSIHRSDDSLNVAYQAKDLYRRHLIFPSLAFNDDDGLALGLSLKITNPGFRKVPYGNSQSFSFLYSFGSSALKLYYSGDWIKILGNADLTIQASAFTPSNTQNFFGVGNQTYFDESTSDIIYYRARFNLYELNPALRWRFKKSMISVGPTFQYYSYQKKENEGRFISMENNLRSSDSSTIAQEKAYAGAALKFSFDSRDNNILPSKGILLDASLTGNNGLNSYSNNYGQLNASLSYYQKLDSSAKIVIIERIGGGLTAGKTAFFQSQFLGGQGNLLGYRQFRFAGDHSLYNNLEVRVKLGSLTNYVLPGQIGLLGLYDVGRVWARSENSSVFHHGVGAGVYFAPASLSLLKLVASYSKEGWYPNFTFSIRY